jgi:hypothetical protein
MAAAEELVAKIRVLITIAVTSECPGSAEAV